MDVPEWVTDLLDRIKALQLDVSLFEARELYSEARDAEAQRDAVIDYLARRIRYHGL